MEILLKKIDAALYPADDEAANYLFQCKQGQVVKAKISKPRNMAFHRKYFALMKYAFEHWNLPEISLQGRPISKDNDIYYYNGQKIEKNYKTFRKNIQILAGFGDPIFTLNGDVRFESKSISFGSMEADDFDKLYNSVINVILKHVLKNYTKDDLDQVVAEILRFD